MKVPDPEYSPGARQKGIQGTTILAIVVDTVDTQGRPSTMMVVKSIGYGLDEAALRAVQSWQFTPATLQGTPVPVVINIEINFRLRA
jgi:protein TonB